MMAGNPNWWSMNDMHIQTPHQQLSHLQYLLGSSPLMSSSTLDDHPDHNFPRSWSQLLMCGLPSDQESHCEYNWFENGEDHQHQQVINNHQSSSREISILTDVIKQEVNNNGTQSNSQVYGHVINIEEEYDDEANYSRAFRPRLNLVSSPPTSCVTTILTNNHNNHLLNFSTTTTKSAQGKKKTQQHSHHSTQGNNSSTGGLAKKPRVQQSSTQPALKVRKEKLGDRITALHQLVSPFGKTDTASVLSEAIGYIRFLVGQIEALSSPYMGNVSKSMAMGHQHSIQETNCLFNEEPGQDGQTHLRSRGLCLVPISCTQHVGSDNGADYWAPAFGGGGF